MRSWYALQSYHTWAVYATQVYMIYLSKTQPNFDLVIRTRGRHVAGL